jgi:acyl-coenzyme A thioesterase PaaI-like protein
MNAMRLAQILASNPFLRFAKLSSMNKNGQEHLQLGFDAFLKNHIGTLHAGALFTAAQADAQAGLELALEQENKEWQIAGYTSQIAYKRPAKGPVWVKTEVAEIDCEKGVAQTVSTLNNEANEPLAELRIQFTLTQGEQ